MIFKKFCLAKSAFYNKCLITSLKHLSTPYRNKFYLHEKFDSVKTYRGIEQVTSVTKFLICIWEKVSNDPVHLLIHLAKNKEK